jgi:transposase-like protein
MSRVISEFTRKRCACGCARPKLTPAPATTGLTTDERERLKALERENRELRKANEILRAASVFFAEELDGALRR